MRWNGTSWDLVPSPSPGMNFLDLNGVVSIAANNAWAVGFYDVSGNWKTLTLHWDGSAWSVVDSPSPDPSLNRLNGVTALSGSDVWAVGYGRTTGTLALHRTGGAWQRARTANEGTGENVLNGISIGSPKDIWAVGHAEDQSLTMHYNGSAWTVVPSPNLEFGVRLEDVLTISQTDAWAVGWSGSASSLDDRERRHALGREHVDDRAHSATGRRARRPAAGDRRGRAERRLGDRCLLGFARRTTAR